MNEKFNPNMPPDDDWAMSKESNLPPNEMSVQPIEDWAMTDSLVAPKKEASDGWKMPEPKFRATSGSLPKNFGRELSDQFPPKAEQPPPNKGADGFAVPTAAGSDGGGAFQIDSAKTAPIPFSQNAPPAAAAAIEPQPDLSEALLTDTGEIGLPPEKDERSKGMRILFAALGITAMVGFAVGFLLIVYFLFFYKAAE